MKYYLSLVLSISLIISSCQKRHDFIKPVDFESYRSRILSGLTVEQAQEVVKNILNEIEINSIGKEIPEITVQNIRNEKIGLRELTDKLSMFYVMNLHCQFGLEGIKYGLPAAMNILSGKGYMIKVIVLVEELEQDKKDSDQFIEKVSQYARFYDNFYLIDYLDSERLNVWACPTAILVDENQIVLNHHSISSDSLKIVNYIESKLLLTDAPRPSRTLNFAGPGRCAGR